MNESRMKAVEEILRGMGADAPTEENESFKQILLNMSEKDFSQLMALGREIAAIGLMMRGGVPPIPGWRDSHGDRKRFGGR